MERNRTQPSRRRWRFAPLAGATIAIVAVILTLACGSEAEPPPATVAPTATATPVPAPTATPTPTAEPDAAGSVGATPTATPEPDSVPTPPTPPLEEPPAPLTTLQMVLDRGELLCGVREDLPGFGFHHPDGTFSGFEIEFCKAIAAAVLGDADKIRYRPTSAATRFVRLYMGEFDVLIHGTTVTAWHDAALTVDFAPIIFYAGQGFAVHADSPIQSTEDMDGATFCIQAGTPGEWTLDSHFRELGFAYTVLGGEDLEMQRQFVARRCEVWTADQSNMASRLSALDDPSRYRVLGQLISKEPLAPVVRDDDSEWRDIVTWVVYGLIAAEEMGVTQANVTDMAWSPPNAAVARLLGVSFQGDDIPDLGFSVDPQFVQRVIGAVGNYGEIYERTLAQIGLARAGTPNALHTDGGLLYAPPFR